MTYRKLGDLLLAEGLITPLQLSIGLAAQQTSSRRIGEILVERGFATEDQIAETLAAQYGYPAADLEGARPEANALSLVSADLALEHAVLPMRLDGDALEIAMADPLDVVATDLVAKSSQKRAIVFIAPRTKLLARIREFYGLEERCESTIDGFPLPARFGSLRPRRKTGEVVLFDAVDLELGRKVTMTAVPSDTPAELEQRWLVQASARVPSKWVCSIFDWFEYEGNSWTVCERLEGESLSHVLRTRGARTLTQATELVAQIAEGVDQLNQHGGRCGLVCPDNVLVRPGGVLLTPFVKPGSEYGCPEMELGVKESLLGDVYALGTLLWECYSGVNPHRAEALKSGSRSSWADPTDIGDGAPHALVEVLSSCLAKEPAERYGSAILLATTLRAYNWSAVLATQASKVTPVAGDREQLLSVIGEKETHEPKGFWKRLFFGPPDGMTESK